MQNWARVIGGNITPKQHELIHHVPQFARQWRTVGFFREEGMEAKHHEVNGINRVLACMRREEERLTMCLRRLKRLEAWPCLCLGLQPSHPQSRVE